ncbi:MAG: NAD(P)/FAD-dependent oxidoreductase [Alphaproteobacteria bacterium]|nr:NAD(P)/FAD-dependent oxidoreductase [Alphaproteobacteria bacterium]
MNSNNSENYYDVLIVGAGPCGIFAVFELGLLGLTACLVDALDKKGGQCAELYPEKPIYDIPGYPTVNGGEIVDKLLEQAAPFDPVYYLSERVDELHEDSNGIFTTITDQGRKITSRAIFIAAGAGCFTPRRPKIESLEDYEGKSVFYAVRNRETFKDSNLVIVGGGDSALDWALDLVDYCNKLTLIHRSDKFRAAPHSVSSMQKLVKQGKMDCFVGNITALHGENGVLNGVTASTKTGDIPLPDINKLLLFFGLNIELGKLADWGIELHDGKLIKVNTEDFATSRRGIFAIGDINHYPGKLKLILSGFHEAALAAQSAFKIARPDEKLIFRYTTSSTDLQKKLGVK